jgi:hypothetical protein
MTQSRTYRAARRYGGVFAIGRIGCRDGYCVADNRCLIHISDARQMIELPTRGLAMDLPHYDLDSLVYFSTDIVVADLFSDKSALRGDPRVARGT